MAKKEQIKNEGKTDIVTGATPGIRPRHIRVMKNIGKYQREAKARKAAGYSESYSQSGHMKQTKSWKRVSDQMLPNELLANVNLWLINFRKYGFRGWQ